MRFKRKQQTKQKDEEVLYHSLVVQIYQGATVGQPNVQFRDEEKVGVAREDVRCIIKEQRMDPTEIKSDYHTAQDNSLDQESTLDANREPFGKLLKCILTNCCAPSVVRLCSFVSRIHCLWFIEFKLGPDAAPVSVRVVS